jgi:hypothetical protein
MGRPLMFKCIANKNYVYSDGFGSKYSASLPDLNPPFY